MPTRKLVTRYEDDLTLWPDRYHKLGLLIGVIAVALFPFIAGSHALAVSHTALIAIVGAIGMMIQIGGAHV